MLDELVKKVQYNKAKAIAILGRESLSTLDTYLTEVRSALTDLNKRELGPVEREALRSILKIFEVQLIEARKTLIVKFKK